MISMSGRSKLVLLNSVGGASLNILLNWFFIPKWGMVGAAWATMIATTMVNVARVSEVLYLEKLHAFGRNLLKPFAIASVLLFPMMKFSLPIASEHIGSLISSALFSLLYIILSYFLILTEDDKKIMKTIMSRIRR